MSAVKILPNIYWVGAIDWTIRNFHGHTYSTQNGTTYNAYLIVDDKNVLVDTVHAPFSKEMIENIKEVIDPQKIDYIIANHVETDHSGALTEILKYATRAKVFGTSQCKTGLYKNYYGNWDFQVVRTNDTLKLGKRTLTFLEAPMLHWPDSMFTYVNEDALILPNDAFGQHYATSGRFDDEVDEATLMDEAAKYYGNILWPLSSIVKKKIEEIKNLNIPIKMIAPSHGVIWRKDPTKIIKAYLSWANNETKNKAVIIYETMWGATEKMARKIADGLTNAKVTVKLFDINKSDPSVVIKEMMDAKAFIVGSSTHDNDMLHNLAGFLWFLKGLKPKNRIGAAFGSYGWAGGATKSIEKLLNEAGIEVMESSVSVKYMPDENEMKKCKEYGKNLAEIIQKKEPSYGKV